MRNISIALAATVVLAAHALAFAFVQAAAEVLLASGRGTYRDIVRPERLVFSTIVAASGAEALGTLLFEERDGHTILRMTMACASKADRDTLLAMRVDAGTLRTLEQLERYLAGPR